MMSVPHVWTRELVRQKNRPHAERVAEIYAFAAGNQWQKVLPGCQVL